MLSYVQYDLVCTSIIVRYHSGGSMELNAHILLLAYMVIYNLNTV
jgi:hypothetical protein